MAIDQERAAHEFWAQWKDKHPCYCGTLHSRDCYMKFAAAYAAECVRAERKRCAEIARSERERLLKASTLWGSGRDLYRHSADTAHKIQRAIEAEPAPPSEPSRRSPDRRTAVDVAGEIEFLDSLTGGNQPREGGEGE